MRDERSFIYSYILFIARGKGERYKSGRLDSSNRGNDRAI